MAPRNEYLLVAKWQEFLYCHNKADIQKTEVHQNMDTGCTTCHNAHASDNDYPHLIGGERL